MNSGFKLSVAIYFGFLGALLTITLALVVTYTLIPFAPSKSYGYEIQAETVCPGEPVDVLVDRAREQPFAADMDELVLTESWVTQEVDSYAPGRSVDVNEATVINPEPVERSTVLSPAVTEAPNMPGTYTVRVEYELRGTQFGIIPRVQNEQYTSNDELLVREPGHPDCGGNDG